MPVTDQELIRRTRQGDNAAFGQLWERHENRVLSHCRRWLDSPHRDPALEAGDLLTETFIRALHGLDRYEDLSAEGRGFETWLLEIAKRLCLKALLRQRRRDPWRAGVALDETGADRQSVEAAAEERLLLRVAAQEINALPEAYQLPLKLSLEQYSHKEVAEILGISVANAMQRLHRARKRLHMRLAERLDAPTSLPSRRLEARLSEIVHDVRIVTIPLPSGGELQLCLGVDRRLSAGESDIAARRAALARQPRAWKKRLELAERLYHSGRWDEAREAYRAVLSLRPDSAEATLALGRMLRYEKRDAEAAGVLRAAPEAGAPGRAALIRAELRVCEGDDEGAVAAFREAVAADPKEASAHYGLVRALGRLSRYGEQLEALETQRAALPGDPSGYIEAYVPCARLGCWDVARPLLERAVALDPNHPLALKHLFQVRMNLGLWDEESLALAERLVRLAPEFSESWSELAWIYAQLGRHEESVGVLEQFLREHPASGEAHASLAWRHHYRGNLIERRHHAERAYALVPESPFVCWTRILVSEAADGAVLDEIAARFPHDAFLSLQVSRAHAAQGRHAAAENFALRAIALQPEAQEARVQLVAVYVARKRWREAADALRLAEDKPHRRYQLTVFQERLGELLPGEDWETADPDELLALSQVAAELGRFDDALRFLATLAESAPTPLRLYHVKNFIERYPELSGFRVPWD